MEYSHGVSQSVFDRFVSLGATKLSRTLYDDDTLGVIVYFWSVDPLKELGYYVPDIDDYVIISREWGEVSLSLQKFEDIS